MVKSSKGSRSRTRGTLTKKVRERGLPPVTKFLQRFEVGDRVIVRLEASDPHGQPHPRYQGRTCIVLERVGRAYKLSFLDGGKPKELIANPIHLLPADVKRPEAAAHA
ncbi:MAG TPA: 50S ribosomal protein L21e [Thermoplasmata archaeon]|nr:50S ribosomal protein L21e [Thermoplasmata archaeon]